MDYKPIQVASNYDVRGAEAPRIVYTPHGIVVAKPGDAVSFLPSDWLTIFSHPQPPSSWFAAGWRYMESGR